MGQRAIQEGDGWRIGWNDGAPIYQGLLAGADWAIELTADEFQSFCRLAQQLAQQMQAMADLLMDEECLTCDAESDQVWVEASGYSHQFALRVMVQSGRRCEGAWSETATRHLLWAMETLLTQPF